MAWMQPNRWHSPKRSRPWGPEHLFASLLALFGLVFALGIPPIQTPDEPSHLHRAYQVSEGRQTTHMVDDWGGGEIPESILNISERFSFLIFRTDLHTTAEPFQALWHRPLQPEVCRSTPFPGSAYYSFVPYVPQALGMAAARALGCGPLGIVYASRLANLCLAVVLVFWAIRLTPIFKCVLGAVALLPMTVQQFASPSADASTIGVAFLLSAFILRWAVAEQRVMSGRTLVALFSLAAWLTLCKFPYAALTLLFLAVPAARLGSRRRYALTASCLFLLVFGLAGWLTQLRQNTPDRLVPPGRGVSIEKQTHFIATHKLRYAKILAATAAEHGKIWLDQLFTLGWLDTPVNPLAAHLYLVFLVIVGLSDRTPRLRPSTRLVVVALAASFLCAAVILTSCYVCGCELRAPLIVGPQGRYFIPFLLLLMLPLYNRVLRVRVAPGVLQTLTAAAGAGVFVAAVAAFVRRYYFAPDWQHLFSMTSLAVALLLFTATALACSFRPRARRATRSTTHVSYHVADDLHVVSVQQVVVRQL